MKFKKLLDSVPEYEIYIKLYDRISSYQKKCDECIKLVYKYIEIGNLGAAHCWRIRAVKNLNKATRLRKKVDILIKEYNKKSRKTIKELLGY